MTEPATTTTDNGNPHDAALYYASLGWRVLPIKPGQKRPPMESWQHAASSDEAANPDQLDLFGGAA